jgi:hypothetical protein
LLFPLLLPLLPPLLELVLLVELVVEPLLVELALVVPPLDALVVLPLEVVVVPLEVLVVPLEVELVVDEVVLPLELLPLLLPLPFELLLDEVELLFVPDELLLVLEPPLDVQVAEALLIICAWQFISVFTALPSATTPMDMPPPSSASNSAYSTADAPRTSFRNAMTPVMCTVMHF